MLRRSHAAGFVLFDALVAFAIAALALTVIFATFPTVTRREADRIYRYQAAEFAHSLLEEYRVTFPLMSPDGQDPSGWSWSITEAPADGQPDQGSDLIIYVTVAVTAWHNDRSSLRVSAQGLIARRRE
jgi:type II secretory pathway pseudopilin PulG